MPDLVGQYGVQIVLVAVRLPRRARTGRFIEVRLVAVDLDVRVVDLARIRLEKDRRQRQRVGAVFSYGHSLSWNVITF